MKLLNIKELKAKAKEKLSGLSDELMEKKYQWILNIIIIVLINLVGVFLYFRLDLTRNRAYSLSQISKKVVSTLQEPLTIKVFFSPDLPAPYNSVYRYLSDMLEEYSEYGNRNFRYEFIDMEKKKDAAAEYGVQPVQVREIKNDRVSSRSAYMGLAVIHGDLIENIPSITEPEGIEYRITTLIQKMNGKIDSLLKLDKPIKVTLYSNNNMPISGMQNLNEKVSEIVKKCNTRNYNKLEYNYVDQDTDKKALELADIYGIQKLKWPNITMEGRQIKAGEGMLGIVLEHNNRFETVHMLSRTIFGQFTVGGLEDLEGRLNGAIDNLISINPKIGYLTGHGERDITNPREGAATFKELLSDMYDLKPIDITKEEIPQDIQTIIINGPRSQFADEELLKIDQHLMNGKSAMFFVDSFTEMQGGQQNMFMREPVVLPLNTGIERLISAYGVTINKDIVLDTSCYRTEMRGFGEQSLYFAPMIGEEGFSKDNNITKYLKRVLFVKTSSLGLGGGSDGGKEGKSVLVSSSKKSWLMQGRISFMPWGMNPPQDSQMKQYNLAVMASGTLNSYFADKEVPVKKADGKAASPVAFGNILKKSVKPGRIIVIGTSEITTPGIIDKEGKNPNAVMVHNMIDYLNGNYDIPEMRSKGLELNPLKESSDTTKLILKIFNIAGLPILVVLAGMVIWRRRALRKTKIMMEFSKGDAKNE